MTPAPAHSAPLYLVICGNFDPSYTPERYVSDMTWAGTIKAIATRQFPSLRQVIEIGTGRDVMAAMLVEVGELIAHTYPSDAGQDRIDWQRDHARDQRKHEGV